MIVRLRNAAFALVFYGLSVPIVVLTPVAGLFGTAALRAYTRGWTRFHRVAARWLLGIDRRFEGTRPAGPALYAGKHQSLYETFELTEVLHAPAMVMKRELAAIPFWGWAARRFGVIVIDRTGGAAALRQLMRAGEAARAEGRSVVIFPEGTRVKPGETPPLQPGFAGLYRALGLPVVPVAVDSGRVWPRQGLKRRGVITFRYGEPIPPGLPRAEVEARVHAAINALEARG